jgi:23S rRNA (cytosine1962-C5)-methyltransferase
MNTIRLKKGEGRLLSAKGAWVFDNEIAEVNPAITDGEIVRIEAFNGFCLGQGFYNSHSKIRIRLVSRSGETPIDETFWIAQVDKALALRVDLTDLHAVRLIFGEADFLPGVIVDKFNDLLVIQCLALGMEAQKHLIVNTLKTRLEALGQPIRGIYERSDAKVRVQEGLPKVKGWLSEATSPMTVISENGVKFEVDVENGQKTGFFLDQKSNREAIHKLVKNKRVLDCFTHTGSFALNAAVAGAREVVAVDVSETAIELAKRNAGLNGVQDRLQFVMADVFEFLPNQLALHQTYDVVILDPPAFAKAKDAVKMAVRGYQEINEAAIKLISDGGYLVTASCTSYVTPELFTQAIERAARNAHRRIRQLEVRTQHWDHPVLWADEHEPYLKFMIFQVVDER